MAEPTPEPPPSTLFSVPTLLAFCLAAFALAYFLTHKKQAPAPSAEGGPSPAFATHSGPASPHFPPGRKYLHVLGAWCSYAGPLPIYFCGKDQAECEATGPGSVCIQGGATLWCLERFDPADSLDKADCYWAPEPCSSAQAKEKASSTLRTECQEFSRN